VAKTRIKKRINGEGYFFTGSDGRKYWRGTCGYDTKGKQKFKEISRKTQKELLLAIENYKNEANKTTVLETVKEYTVSEWLDYWYNNYAINKVKEATRAILLLFQR